MTYSCKLLKENVLYIAKEEKTYTHSQQRKHSNTFRCNPVPACFSVLITNQMKIKVSDIY